MRCTHATGELVARRRTTTLRALAAFALYVAVATGGHAQSNEASAGAQEPEPPRVLRTDPDAIWFGARFGYGLAASVGRIYDASPFFYGQNGILDDPIPQFEGGLVAEIRLLPALVLEAAPGLTTKGRSYGLDQGLQGDLLDDVTITESILYVTLPVFASGEFSLAPALRVRGGGGLGLNAKVYQTGTSTALAGAGNDLPTTYFAPDFPNVFSVSLLARAGVELGAAFGVGVYVTYEYHLLPDFDYGEAESARYHSLNFSVSSMFVPFKPAAE